MNQRRKATTIKDDYNSWAQNYDSDDNKTRDLDKKITIQTLREHPFRKVIELGCGTGKNTDFLLEKADELIGLDFSEKMLDKARSKFKNDRVRFRQSDITQDWKIPDEFADLITCSLVLEHIEDLDVIFKQAKQKLKKNGIFFISELHPAKQYLGSKANYVSPSGTRELETFFHHLSDYLNTARENELELIELNEWFDSKNKPKEIPRLISFVFQK